jgi:hypothetical protein
VASSGCNLARAGRQPDATASCKPGPPAPLAGGGLRARRKIELTDAADPCSMVQMRANQRSWLRRTSGAPGRPTMTVRANRPPQLARGGAARTPAPPRASWKEFGGPVFNLAWRLGIVRATWFGKASFARHEKLIGPNNSFKRNPPYRTAQSRRYSQLHQCKRSHCKPSISTNLANE